jgi:hypothetical protein
MSECPNPDEVCNWPDEYCEWCAATEEDAEYKAWRARWEGRAFESPPDPWVDESRVGEVPF